MGDYDFEDYEGTDEYQASLTKRKETYTGNVSDTNRRLGRPLGYNQQQAQSHKLRDSLSPYLAVLYGVGGLSLVVTLALWSNPQPVQPENTKKSLTPPVSLSVPTATALIVENQIAENIVEAVKPDTAFIDPNDVIPFEKALENAQLFECLNNKSPEEQKRILEAIYKVIAEPKYYLNGKQINPGLLIGLVNCRPYIDNGIVFDIKTSGDKNRRFYGSQTDFTVSVSQLVSLIHQYVEQHPEGPHNLGAILMDLKDEQGRKYTLSNQDMGDIFDKAYQAYLLNLTK